MFDAVTFIGLAASIMVTVAYVPELWKTIRQKHTRDISLLWIITLDISQILFFIYSTAIDSIPVMIASGCSIVMVTVMLGYKLKYKNK
jgi:MtN3 and saliva related transmembrane protein